MAQEGTFHPKGRLGSFVTAYLGSGPSENKGAKDDPNC